MQAFWTNRQLPTYYNVISNKHNEQFGAAKGANEYEPTPKNV